MDEAVEFEFVGMYSMNNMKYFFKKLLITVVAIIIMALGVAAMRFSACGIDPFGCMAGGIDIYTGIGFGTAMLLQNGIILLGVFIFDKSKIGIGTILNMTITGYGSDFFMYFIQKILTPDNLPLRIAALVSGIVIICFTAAIYIEANLGIAPYDAVALIISQKTKKERWFRWIRIATDGICSIIGLAFGNMPGIGTIAMSLFAGPLIAFFRKKNAALFIERKL
ncbi:MAG: DUF6198 family protein [Treponema sp.]|jgi:uncharacterized membrane protein YczE|nr:DUF6198 family protein [Treponema sp.]